MSEMYALWECEDLYILNTIKTCMLVFISVFTYIGLSYRAKVCKGTFEKAQFSPLYNTDWSFQCNIDKKYSFLGFKN